MRVRRGTFAVSPRGFYLEPISKMRTEYFGARRPRMQGATTSNSGAISSRSDAADGAAPARKTTGAFLRWALVLIGITSCLFAVPTLLAQAQPPSGVAAETRAEADSGSDAEVATESASGQEAASANGAREPRLLHLEPLDPPPGSPPTTGSDLSVRVLIGPDGSASIDDPDLDPDWRATVERALSLSRFEPATIEGRPVIARVKVIFPVEGAAADQASAGEPGADGQPAAGATLESSPQPDLAFGAIARVPKTRSDLRRLEVEELRELPGAFGDAFRALESLPGVAPYLSGLPYVYVRGAPPAGTLYIYDEIPLPLLFHLGLGPAVIHPAMIGPVEFYPGAGPARYGRRTGGLFTSAYRERDESRGDAFGEVELRAIDLMGMGNVRVGEGEITAAGRYGYPGLLLSIFSPEISLDYWDYQLRLEHPVARRTRLQLVGFGSYDSLSLEQDSDGVTLTFHRMELRLIRDIKRWQYGAALLLGYDESENDASTIEDAQAGYMVSKRIGPRVWLAWNDGEHGRFRAGADLVGMVGEIIREVAPPSTGRGGPRGSRPYLSAPTTRQRDQSVFEQFNNPLYTSVAARSTMGIFGEVGFRPHRRWDVDLGLRGDLWLTGTRGQVGVDPRLLVTHFLTEALDLHAAFGLAHQPAVFLLPLPGVADVALDDGLQEAIQSGLGAGLDLPFNARVELELFLHRYSNLMFPELTLEKFNQCDPSSGGLLAGASEENICQGERGFPRATALAYGGELFLRRPLTETVSGWLSYTLAWAEAESSEGFEFTPVFDMRHVGNLALQYRFAPGWRAGARLHVRSGQMFAVLTDDLRRLERRLPGFYRIDAQAAYKWRTGWGAMQLTAEMFNLTLSREPRSITCGLDVTDRNRPAPGSTCTVQYAPALFFPNLGLRAEF